MVVCQLPHHNIHVLARLTPGCPEVEDHLYVGEAANARVLDSSWLASYDVALLKPSMQTHQLSRTCSLLDGLHRCRIRERCPHLEKLCFCLEVSVLDLRVDLHEGPRCTCSACSDACVHVLFTAAALEMAGQWYCTKLQAFFEAASTSSGTHNHDALAGAAAFADICTASVSAWHSSIYSKAKHPSVPYLATWT
jgi:hypothetical protein